MEPTRSDILVQTVRNVTQALGPLRGKALW
jgi:hypothetical protein